MSVKYRNASGQESIIAGLTPGGDIEAGAVATRSGKVDVSPLEVGAYQVTNVTFDTPMPDDTYIINIDCTSGRLNIATFGKTANGFSIVYLNSSNLTQPQGDLIDWTATKTYTVQHDIQNTEAIANIEAAMPADAGLANKLATKSYVDNADSAIDSRLDNIEDAMPTTASVTNKLATKNDVDNVQIDALGDIADVEVTGVQSGQTILWDSDDSKWVAGQAGKVYTAGDGIEISTLDKISVDDEYVPLTFVGTKAQWDELTVSQKAKYTLVDLTDDPATGAVVVTDTVAEGNMNPVTSNAVYGALPLIQTGSIAPGNASTKKVINVTFPKAFETVPTVICNFYTLAANESYISQASVIVMSTTTTGFSVMVKTDQTVNMTTAVHWLAIAY